MTELPIVLRNAVAIREEVCGIDEPTCQDPLPAVVEVDKYALNQKTLHTLVKRETTDDE